MTTFFIIKTVVMLSRNAIAFEDHLNIFYFKPLDVKLNLFFFVSSLFFLPWVVGGCDLDVMLIKSVKSKKKRAKESYDKKVTLKLSSNTFFL